MKWRPIIFRPRLVRAIQRGIKKETRRIVNAQPQYSATGFDITDHGAEIGDKVMFHEWPCILRESRGRDKAAAGDLTPWKCPSPYGQPGDGLYVRERWAVGRGYDGMRAGLLPRNPPILKWYGADWLRATDGRYRGGRWRPSIHMPRWLSRIYLIVEGVRVERLHDITSQECVDEGMFRKESEVQILFRMAKTWDEIHGRKAPKGWAHNPWVWVVRFRMLNVGEPAYEEALALGRAK